MFITIWQSTSEKVKHSCFCCKDLIPSFTFTYANNIINCIYLFPLTEHKFTRAAFKIPSKVPFFSASIFQFRISLGELWLVQRRWPDERVSVSQLFNRCSDFNNKLLISIFSLSKVNTKLSLENCTNSQLGIFTFNCCGRGSLVILWWEVRQKATNKEIKSFLNNQIGILSNLFLSVLLLIFRGRR